MTPSLLDELRAVRAQVQAEAEKTLDIPGSGGRIAIKFRAPENAEARERLTGIVAAYRVGAGLTAGQEKQLIIDCCDEILVRGSDGEMTRPEGDGPQRFDASDERWGGDVKTAHDCVDRLFNLDIQPLACSGIADNLVDWLQGLDAELRARAEGNSESPPAATESDPQPSSA